MEKLSTRDARRLALARAGLLKPDWTGLPAKAGRDPDAAARAVIARFGYLQLDTISVAGARTHAIVLASRLAGFPADRGEELLRPGAPLFEYWGHEACWMPIELYPHFAFRRRDLREHPWWGPLLTEQPGVAREILGRVRAEGPLRSKDLGGGRGDGVARRVAASLWATGKLAIRERRNFQKVYDLPERVIPDPVRRRSVPRGDAIRTLVLRSLAGHGWAETRTVVDTFRLNRRRKEVVTALSELADAGEVVPCSVGGTTGWIRPGDLELAARLRRVRPRPDRGVLLSPFDPVLWDRKRVGALFDFDYRIEIYTPVAKRKYGYYCLPVLVGERLVGRVDLKAERKRGALDVLSTHYEADPPSAADRAATDHAIDRFARAVGLTRGG
jgi:uncharacterized protein YcaQ